MVRVRRRTDRPNPACLKTDEIIAADLRAESEDVTSSYTDAVTSNTVSEGAHDMTMPTRITEGPERQLLESTLDHARAELIDTVRGLSETEASRHLVSSQTTPVGLLKHAAFAERKWFQKIVAELPDSECDGSMVGEASFTVGDHESIASVIAEFEHASNRARMITADVNLDATRWHPDLGTISLRWIYLLMIQEFARHAGHGDILREQTDGTRRT